MIANHRERTGHRLATLAPGLPIIGNGRDLRDALGTFVRCYHEVGPIYRLRDLLSESERTSQEIAAVISERLAALH